MIAHRTRHINRILQSLGVAGAIAIGATSLVGCSNDGSHTALAAAPAVTTDPRTVTVSGHGAITVKPDTATLELGVSVTKPTAKDAMAEAATKADALIKTLKAAGVADADIATDGLSLNPEYGVDGSTVTGYVVTNSVTATIRKIADTGTILDAATNLVGNEITFGGISFSVSDNNDALSQARKAAVADAKRRAGDYAGAAGASVGVVDSIDENSFTTPVLYDATATGSVANAPSTPIQPGTQDITVDVTVTYELQ